MCRNDDCVCRKWQLSVNSIAQETDQVASDRRHLGGRQSDMRTVENEVITIDAFE